ncbi:hypothetical protein [Thalassobacillus devorans]|uniref:hypothetical protein n=1 Tax=Thalassobacillus devorans TaxID=279813 RepID=UPI000A1CDF5B|nr:hypothetical protein [Thalassobacillus devorans]
MQININVNQYEGNNFRHGYRGLNATDENNKRLLSDISGMSVVEFVEKALEQAVKSIVDNSGTAEAITVNLPAEVVLPAALQTHLNDKYSADPVVSSVTFA